MESTDTPWAKSHDIRIKKKFDVPPSPAALFFHDFLKSRKIKRGRLVDLGCGNGRNAIYFASNGFEVHGVDIAGESIIDLDLHAVTPHCHSVTEYWLFEDDFFDQAIDILCYSEQPSGGDKRTSYRNELKRTLKQSGFYLLSILSSGNPNNSKKPIEKEFFEFEIVKFEKGKDNLRGMSIDTLNLIMKKK